MKAKLNCFWMQHYGPPGFHEDDWHAAVITEESERSFKTRLKEWAKAWAMKNLKARSHKDFRMFLMQSTGIVIEGYGNSPDFYYNPGDITEIDILEIKEADLLSPECFSRLQQQRAQARRAEQRRKQDEAAEKMKKREQASMSMLIKKHPTLAAEILAETKRPLSELP